MKNLVLILVLVFGTISLASQNAVGIQQALLSSQDAIPVEELHFEKHQMVGLFHYRTVSYYEESIKVSKEGKVYPNENNRHYVYGEKKFAWFLVFVLISMLAMIISHIKFNKNGKYAFVFTVFAFFFIAFASYVSLAFASFVALAFGSFALAIFVSLVLAALALLVVAMESKVACWWFSSGYYVSTIIGLVLLYLS